MPAQRRLICHINHTQCAAQGNERKTHLNVASTSAAHNSNAADGHRRSAAHATVAVAVVAATASAIPIENCQLDSNKRNALYAIFN